MHAPYIVRVARITNAMDTDLQDFSALCAEWHLGYTYTMRMLVGFLVLIYVFIINWIGSGEAPGYQSVSVLASVTHTSVSEGRLFRLAFSHILFCPQLCGSIEVFPRLTRNTVDHRTF